MHTQTLIELLRLAERTAGDAIAILERESGHDAESRGEPTAEAANGPVSGDWHEIDRLRDQSYSWPDGSVDEYGEIVVYEGSAPFAGMRLGIGQNADPARNGETQVFIYGSRGGSARPLTVFFRADDFASSHELVSMIRGREASLKTFGPTLPLPASYGQFKTDVLGRRIRGKWNVQAVVAKDDDHKTMLTHTALQARLRRLV